MNCQPNIHLLKTGLQSCFERREELPVCLGVFRVHEYSIEPIAILNSTCSPDAFNHLGFPRNSAKAALDFGGRVGDKVRRHWSAIVKSQRQVNLEATVCAH